MRVDNDELEYLNPMSKILVEKVPKSSKVILYTILVLLILFFVWANYAQVEQLVRTQAQVIPSGQNQIVQNFEGGIVSDILVEEGDFVKKGQVLLKLSNKAYLSSYEKNLVEIEELKIKKDRLFAEANDENFEYKKNNKLYKKEYALYLSNKEQLDSKREILKSQLDQKKKEKNELSSRVVYLRKNYGIISQERKLMMPLVKKEIIPKVEYLKLQRELNSIRDELESAKLSIKTIDSTIVEFENRLKGLDSEFKNVAQKEYNDVSSKIEQMSKQNYGLEDQVKRTSILSPANGLIKKIYVNTIGGSVKPGMDLVEIVPKDKKLFVEGKVQPKDIAFLKIGQEASIKFTAYDFSIYGTLKGTIKKISPDSITVEKETYFTIYIKTEKDFLIKNDKKLEIIPGMRGSADIITGKRSVLSYILKPIIKVKQYAFTEN